MPSKKSIKIPLILITLIFILSLGISAVSASSTTTDGSTIYVSTSGSDDYDGLSDVYNSTTKSGPKATIKNATWAVADKGTVHIAKGTYNESGIVLEKNMSIVGAGETETIVNGGHFLSIFEVDGFDNPTINITISNLSLINGTAIYAYTDSGMVCQWGGAIYSSGGTVNANHVTFTNNTGAYDCGAIYSFNGGTVNVNDCKFYNNTVPTGNCGVIYNNGGTLNVVNSIFSDNTATDSNAGNGGAIYNQYGTATITGCTFTSNTAAGNGGAVYNANGLMYITGCDFIGNNASALNQKFGGAIYNDGGTLSVADSNFTNNAAFFGGAICDDNGGSVTIDNSKFDKNNGANYGYGGAICTFYNGGTVNIANSKFTENIASNGGAILSYAGVLTVNNSTFTQNSAIHNGYGGAIDNEGAGTVSNSTFISNTCDYAGTISNFGTLDVANCTFLNNTAGQYGGAIWTGGTSVTVNNCTIMGNSAKYYGGGIHSELQSQLTAHYNRIVNNTAKYGNELSGNINADVAYNWWGTNNPTSVAYGSTGTDVYGLTLPSWLTLNITTDSSSIPIGSNVTATAVLQQENADGSYSSVGDNMPEGIPVTFSGVKGTVKTTSTVLVSGEATTVFTATNAGAASVSATVDSQTVTAPLTVDKSSSNISISDMNSTNKKPTALNVTLTDGNGNPIVGQNVTFSVNGTNVGSATTNSRGIASLTYTPTSSGNFTVTASFSGSDDYLSSTRNGTLTVAPSAYLYIKVTSSKNNPSVGEATVLKYKLGNNGTDTAYNVVASFVIPDGLKFVTASVDVGNWTYNSTTRTLTWTLDSVPVGDPYLNITAVPLASGSYTVIPAITSSTYNANTNIPPAITVIAPQNVGSNSSSGNSSVSTVKAVSTVKTIPMQHTGVPLAGLLLGILAVLGGATLPRKK